MLCALRQIKQAQGKIFQKSICSYQGLPLPYSEVCPVLLFIANNKNITGHPGIWWPTE